MYEFNKFLDLQGRFLTFLQKAWKSPISLREFVLFYKFYYKFRQRYDQSTNVATISYFYYLVVLKCSSC